MIFLERGFDMREIETDKNLIACCGLYCGACRAYLMERCGGCSKNIKATWCKVKSCNAENKTSNCSECKTYADVKNCAKFNNIFAKIFGFIFRSDRRACINLIKEKGAESYAKTMSEKKAHTIKR